MITIILARVNLGSSELKTGVILICLWGGGGGGGGVASFFPLVPFSTFYLFSPFLCPPGFLPFFLFSFLYPSFYLSPFFFFFFFFFNLVYISFSLTLWDSAEYIWVWPKHYSIRANCSCLCCVTVLCSGVPQAEAIALDTVTLS